MQEGREERRGRRGEGCVVIFDSSQKSSVIVSLHIYNIVFYFKL